MILPRRADLLSRLSGRAEQWLKEYEPYARALREYYAILHVVSENPKLGPSKNEDTRRVIADLTRRDQAREMPLEEFEEYLDEEEMSLWIAHGKLEQQEFEGISKVRYLEGLCFVTEQMIGAVRCLYRESLKRLDTAHESSATSDRPSDSIPEQAAPVVGSTPEPRNEPLIHDRPGYLQLILNPVHFGVGRVGYKPVISLIRAPLLWGLFNRLYMSRDRVVRTGDLHSSWESFGGSADPGESAIYDAVSSWTVTV